MAGYTDRELKGKLRSLHERLKSQKGKILFFVRVSASGDDYHFLTMPIDKTTTVTAVSRLPASMIEKPSPKFDRWQVFEMRPDEPRRIYHRPLARFDRLEFSLSAMPVRKDDREPIRVAVKGFLRVGGAKSRKKDLDGSQGHQGINLAQRQITMPRWEDQAVPEVVLTFHPGQWKLPPPPPGFEELLKRLDEKR